MLSGYRAVFRAPGSAAFCAAAFVMRMPIAIYPIGIVLIISARNGHYGFAGVLSACYTFGGAVGMPALSALIDRLGQRRLIVPAMAVHAACVVALAIMVRTDVADGWLVVPAVVFGFTYLSVGSLVRARWSNVWEGRPEVTTAMSLESVLDELIFVVGPLIATVIATQVRPVLVLYVAAGLVVVGSLWLATLHASEPPVHPPGDGGRESALRAPGMALLTVATLPIGAVLASAEVSAVAFCGQHGHRGLSGLALACVAGGSALSGLVYGAVSHGSGALGQFRRQALIFAVLPFVLLAAVDVWALLGVDFVLGLGIAPVLIAAFGLAQHLVPLRTLTEGLTWINTGISVGYGTGAALVGGIADQHGARTAFWVVIGAGLLVGVLGWTLNLRLRGRETSAGAADPAVVGAGWDHG